MDNSIISKLIITEIKMLDSRVVLFDDLAQLVDVRVTQVLRRKVHFASRNLGLEDVCEGWFLFLGA